MKTYYDLQKELKDGTFVITRYGNTIHVHTTDDVAMAEVNKAVKKALANGQSLYHRDGSKEFITHDAIHNIEDDSYIWDKSGDRVKHNTVKHIVAADGTHMTEVIGTSFRKF